MNKIENKKPLVSIVIVTYNSSQYVLETLESAKEQSYKNIELIVTDDCSKDNTVELCQKWIKDNNHRFVNSRVLTVERNTGISANCNRGAFNANGDWIKLIAGDDILKDNCIERFIVNANSYPDYQFFFSDVEIFGNGDEAQKRAAVRRWMDNSLNRFESITNSKSLYKKLLVQNIISSPSAFIQNKAFVEVGGFDEELKLIEDYPFWLKITKQNYRIKSIREQLVRYRVNASSVQTSETYMLALELFRQKYVFKNILSNYLIPLINQLKPKRKDFIYCKILKITSYPQRMIWKLKLKFAV